MITTPFGQFRVCDAHTHFLTRNFYEQLGRMAGLNGVLDTAHRLGWDDPPSQPESIGLRWVAEMDRHGIDRMVALHTLPGDLDAAAPGIAAAAGRLVGFAMINPLDAGAAAKLEHVVTQFGFRGVSLFPAMFHFSMLSDAAYAILDVANRHDLAVFVHCGVLKVAFRQKLGIPSDFDGTLANPLSLQRPCAEFPRCRFIVPHLGSGLFRELLMLADQVENVYTDTSGASGWAKYLDGSPTPAQVLQRAIDVMGSQRLLFGSDSTFFPRGWRRDVFDQQLTLFRKAGVAEVDLMQILCGNFARVLPA